MTLVVVPDYPRYRELAARTRTGRTRVGIHVVYVTAAGAASSDTRAGQTVGVHAARASSAGELRWCGESGVPAAEVVREHLHSGASRGPPRGRGGGGQRGQPPVDRPPPSAATAALTPDRRR